MKNTKFVFTFFFSFLFLLHITNSVLAQEESEKKISYGIKVGTTLSNFSSEQPHNNYKPGLIAGCFITYKLSSNIALQMEPSYMQQGGNLIKIFDPAVLSIPDYPFALEIEDQKILFHNIDIPLLFKYDKIIGGLKVFAVVGPSLGINIHTTAKTDVSARSKDIIPVYYDFYKEENITSNINLLQYGVTGGLGFETRIRNLPLIFDVRYRYSLNKTYEGYSYLGIHQIQGDLSSNTIYITLGIGF
ncbi:MAG: PorT family protein [Bacteroidales bacterium]|nr:PorT family protein [Bacteroidales bacterium]HPD95568.1 porin family protein [Tenuifilaceae bacterium]HRX31747.1 porin family protein [Tenuifilaceae bacterium]